MSRSRISLDEMGHEKKSFTLALRAPATISEVLFAEIAMMWIRRER
jgi:hypothetical protein